MTIHRTRKRRESRTELSLGAIAFLRDDEYDPGLGGALWPGNEHYWLCGSDDEPYFLRGEAARQVSGLSARDLVDKYGDKFLAEWIAERPGTRPAWWYRFRRPGPIEPRQRLGGIGVTWKGTIGADGIPTGCWVTRENKDWWGGHPGPVVDPEDSPVFESQESYLRRLGVLGVAELARLGPDAFEPVTIRIRGAGGFHDDASWDEDRDDEAGDAA
jgi:hypothetical protein